jgi:hypothetical protein
LSQKESDSAEGEPALFNEAGDSAPPVPVMDDIAPIGLRAPPPMLEAGAAAAGAGAELPLLPLLKLRLEITLESKSGRPRLSCLIPPV